jgi:hypothetical protein
MAVGWKELSISLTALLREIVKFHTYVDSLEAATKQKAEVYAMRKR